MNRLNADFAYTLDGGPLGDIEDETFSADAMDVTFEGLSANPGYAKGKMINAIKLAAEFVSKLPNTNLSPETTSGREGFVHPTSVSGGLESALVQFIIRDHDTSKLKIYEDFLVELAQSIVDQYKGSKFTFKVKEQYRNMKEELVKVPFVADYAVEAMIKANVTPKRAIIRGGTDGSRLSFMGLPCPNIFTGEMAIHSRHEYVSVQDMLAAKNTLIELVQIWTNHKTKNG
jgi:tripeptide aminopeptidase